MFSSVASPVVIQSKVPWHFYDLRFVIFLHPLQNYQPWDFCKCNILTNLSQMDLPTLICRTSPFPILWVLGGTFHCFPNCNRMFFEQTVKNLIRHHIMLCLIWICTLCLHTIKRKLCLHGLILIPPLFYCPENVVCFLCLLYIFKCTSV